MAGATGVTGFTITAFLAGVGVALAAALETVEVLVAVFAEAGVGVAFAAAPFLLLDGNVPVATAAFAGAETAPPFAVLLVAPALELPLALLFAEVPDAGFAPVAADVLFGLACVLPAAFEGAGFAVEVAVLPAAGVGVGDAVFWLPEFELLAPGFCAVATAAMTVASARI